MAGENFPRDDGKDIPVDFEALATIDFTVATPCPETVPPAKAQKAYLEYVKQLKDAQNLEGLDFIIREAA